ncbi:hypothetical protein VNO80_08833 [Phaseolus coccineus]|uniref:Uncharacterized protein n=1 Tax=Phaseolus coccineus TaxID=3886 RepID=A0AAN9NAG8_PHACN
MPSKLASPMTVQASRIRTLKDGSCGEAGSGPVVYWMFRDQRLSRRQMPSSRVHAQGLAPIVPPYATYSSNSIFLVPDFPDVEVDLPTRKWVLPENHSIDWDDLIADVLRRGAEAPEHILSGGYCGKGSENGFLTKGLKGYSLNRNNPSNPNALSGFTPDLHFGQICAQRCAFEARKHGEIHILKLVYLPCTKVFLFLDVLFFPKMAIDAFLEVLIVRRELADNYCFYEPHYNSLWNASQLEMVHNGKMHGFMPLNWFEWDAPGLCNSATQRQCLRSQVASYFDGPLPQKINLISCELIVHISDIKLIRTDTTLDLSQKAEKGRIRLIVA